MVEHGIRQSDSAKNMLDTRQKGNLTELQCLAAFVEQGCTVSVPYGNNSKYDFIADIEGQLLKIQVKTSREGENVIFFSCETTHVNCSGIKRERYTKEQVDYFATMWDGQCYLVPIAECSKTKTLRFAPPKNGQVKGITFATEYFLEKQIQKIKEKIAEH